MTMALIFFGQILLIWKRNAIVVSILLSSFIPIFVSCTKHGVEQKLRKERAVNNGNGHYSFLQEIEELGKGNPLTGDVMLVGNFIAAHKYFELDVRYLHRSTLEGPTFFKNFPTPPLRELNPEVHRACEEGAESCIREIASVAKVASVMSWFNHQKVDSDKNNPADSFFPFRSHLELFQYRTTASYYLCWYTDRREDVLAVPDVKDCFKNISKVGGAKEVFDSRVLHFLRTSWTPFPFACPYLWFCPDPCFGRGTGGQVKSLDRITDDKDNPCSSMKEDKNCFWSIGKNTNFIDLTLNRINFTCECGKDREGFYWEPKFQLCVDVDECLQCASKCPSDKVCLNTVGSYKCACRRGFFLNATTDKCQRLSAMMAKSHLGMEARDQHHGGTTAPTLERESRFWYLLDTMFSFGSCGSLSVGSLSLIFTNLIICFVLAR